MRRKTLPSGKGQRILLITVALVLLLVNCQPSQPKMYRVGIICGSEFFLPVVEGFKAKMAEYGYVEGKNITYAIPAPDPRPAEQRRIAEQFVAEGVDLILAVPTEPAVAAKIATQGTNIPVVFAYAGIEDGSLITDSRQPGGNITGVRFPGPEQIAKRLEILVEAIPRVRRVWIGYHKEYPNTAPVLAALRPLASSLNVTLVEVPALTVEELRADLDARAAADDIGVDGIILMPDILNHSPEGWAVINRFAKKHRVPIGGSFLYTVEDGALFGNCNDLFRVGELAAFPADQILRGVPPSTIPVLTPNDELYVNLRAAYEVGIQMPEHLVAQAVRVIR